MPQQEPLDQYSNIQPLVQLEINNAINDMADKSKYSVVDIPAHVHTGIDSNKIEFDDLTNKKFYVTYEIEDGSNSNNYGNIFIAPFACTLLAVQEVHNIAANLSGELRIEKLTDTQGKGSGVIMTTNYFNLVSAANTIQTGVIEANSATINLKIGDRIGIKDAGALTNLRGVYLILTLTY